MNKESSLKDLNSQLNLKLGPGPSEEARSYLKRAFGVILTFSGLFSVSDGRAGLP